MPIPTAEWNPGAWNPKQPQFDQLGKMVGLSPKPSIAEVEAVLRKVASATVFAESVDDFLRATGQSIADVKKALIGIEARLGLLQPIPFMSLQGLSDPRQFNGVALWPGATVAWMDLRLAQIMLAEQTGATFERVIVLGGSRVCNSAADRRHPHISKRYNEGEEPTERALMRRLVEDIGAPDGKFVFPELPEKNEADRPLSLEQQLNHLVATGQWAELVGDRPVYVPSNPNALYVPLHVRRVLGLHNVWFSQAGARLMKEMPAYWWPQLQDVMTTPNGIFRLWLELLRAGCLKH